MQYLFFFQTFLLPLLLLLINWIVFGHEFYAIFQLGLDYWCEWNRSAPFVLFIVVNVLYMLGLFFKKYQWLLPLIYFYKAAACLTFNLGLVLLKISLCTYSYAYFTPQEKHEFVVGTLTYSPVTKRGIALSNTGLSVVLLFFSVWAHFNYWALNKCRESLEHSKQDLNNVEIADLRGAEAADLILKPNKSGDQLPDELCGPRILKSHHGIFLRANTGEKKVDQAEEAVVWNIEDSNGMALFKTMSSPSLYLRAHPDGNVDLVDKPDDWEKWTSAKNKNGTWSFQSFHGQWLSAQKGGWVCTVKNWNEWEYWQVEMPPAVFLKKLILPLLLLLLICIGFGYEIFIIFQTGPDYWYEWKRAAPFVTFLVLTVLFVVGCFVKKYKWLLPLIYFHQAAAYATFTLGLAMLTVSTFAYVYAYFTSHEKQEIVLGTITFVPVDKRSVALTNMASSVALLIASFWTAFNYWVLKKMRKWLKYSVIRGREQKKEISEKLEMQEMKKVENDAQLSREASGRRIISTSNGSFLSVNRDKKTELSRREPADAEHWQVEDHAGKVVFKTMDPSIIPGLFLRAYPDGRVTLSADHPQELEQWTPVKNEDGSWSFQSSGKRWLSAQQNLSVSTVERCQKWEHFWLESYE